MDISNGDWRICISILKGGCIEGDVVIWTDVPKSITRDNREAIKTCVYTLEARVA